MARVTRTLKSKPGILYVILVEMDGKSLVKIGVTHRKIEDRVSEILVGIFKKYREFPYCRPKRFITTANPYKKEKDLHNYFAKFNYQPSKKFSGSTEFFDVPLDDVVAVYDRTVKKSAAKPRTKPRTKAKTNPKKAGVFFSTNKKL